MIAHPEGRGAVNRSTRARFARHCRPLPRLTGSQWAERYRVLSPEATRQHGVWRNDVVPYLAEIMDAVTDPRIQRVTVVAPSQSAKTELLLNILGFFMHQQPSPILVVQPTVDMAQDFSKLRLAPMLRDSPVLRDMVAPARSRDSNNTILSKQYPGGQLDIVGANSPAGLAARPKRVVFLDEVDRFPESAGAEGDPFDIAYARTRSYQHARKIIAVSSPTFEPVQDTSGRWSGSRIWREFQSGTQEVRELPCPQCGTYQPMEFDALHWDRVDDRGPVVPSSVYWLCAACKYHASPGEKVAMAAKGVWRATSTSLDPVHRSFRVHGLVAAFALWPELAQEFVDKHRDPVRLQTFVNTALGECWKDREVENQAGGIRARALRYDGGTDDEPVRFHVPREAGVITAGVDVQHDRLEIVVRAWGVGEQSWLVETAVLRGDTSQSTLWAELDTFRKSRTWRHESGAPMTIQSMAIDAGDGTHAKIVYAFCAPRLAERVYAVKGSTNPAAPLIPNKPTKVKPGRLYLIGVNGLTEALYRRLSMPTPGPGYLHFNAYADDDYVTQLLSMERHIDPLTRRRSWRVRRNVRNEKHDCENYAYAALLLGPVSLIEHEVTRVNAEGERLKSGTSAPEPVAAAASSDSSWLGRARGGGSWMGRLGR